MTDWYIFNGDLERGRDFDFINLVRDEQKSDKCILILVTAGGDPDAGL